MYTREQIIHQIDEVLGKLAAQKAQRTSSSDVLRKSHADTSTPAYTPKPSAAKAEMDRFLDTILVAHRSGPQQEGVQKRAYFSAYTPVTRDQDRVAKAIYDGHTKGGARDLSKLFLGDPDQQEQLRKAQAQNAKLVTTGGRMLRKVSVSDLPTTMDTGDGAPIADTGGSRPGPMDNGFPSQNLSPFERMPSSESNLGASSPEAAARTTESGQQDQSLDAIKAIKACLRRPSRRGLPFIRED